MRVLVSGDRNWTDRKYIEDVLSAFAAMVPIEVLIEGEAGGVDVMARDWADSHYVQVAPYPAQWRTFGKRAGPIRNQQMLDEGKPDIVIAFHPQIWDSKGTRDMMTRALRAGIPVHLYPGKNRVAILD